MQDLEHTVVLYVSITTQNPLCNCGEIEDPFHFLFEWNQYNIIRRDMLTCVSTICKSKDAKIRNRYDQVPDLAQDTNGKVTNSQLDTTNESQPSP